MGLVGELMMHGKSMATAIYAFATMERSMTDSFVDGGPAIYLDVIAMTAAGEAKVKPSNLSKHGSVTKFMTF